MDKEARCADVKMIVRYNRRPEGAKQTAVNLLCHPFQPKRLHAMFKTEVVNDREYNFLDVDIQKAY